MHRSYQEADGLNPHVFLNQSSEITCIIDEKGICSFIGRSIKTVLGYEPTEIHGNCVFDYMVPEDRTLLIKRFSERLKEGGTPLYREYRFIHKDKSIVHLRVIFEVPGDDSNISGFIVHATDVTELVNTEQARKDSLLELHLADEINRAALDGASIGKMGAMVMDALNELIPSHGSRLYFLKNGRLELISNEKSHLVESIKALAGIDSRNIIPSLDENNAFRNLILNKEVIVAREKNDILQIIKDHTTNKNFQKLARPALKILKLKAFILIPLVDNDRLIGLISLAFRQEISDYQIGRLKRFSRNIVTALAKTNATKEIEEQKEFTNTILNNLPAEIAVIDTDYKYLYVNSSSIHDDERRKKIIGKTDLEFLEPTEENIRLADFRRKQYILCTTEKKEVSWIDQHEKNGEIFYILRKIVPYLSDGKIKFIIGYGVNITEQIITKNLLEKEVVKSMEFQSMLLSSQLNPHFIFNALNSVQYYILDNKAEEAIDFVGNFSKLMRQTLSNSNSLFIQLSEELEFLDHYLSLEKTRLNNKFDYSIHVSDDIDTDEISIPPMLLQPYLENTIVHGITNKKGQGKIEVNFSIDNTNELRCAISDNGIGREKALELKHLRGNSGHKSMGIGIIATRLDLLEKVHKKKFNVRIKDLYDKNNSPAGTKVQISIPLFIEEF